ncbi:MAG: type II secretion system F family protein, partial [Myxococcota bacterium]
MKPTAIVTPMTIATARLDTILDTLDKGGTLTEALEAAQQFHPTLVAAVAQAEVTGTLDTTLIRVAERER